MLRKEKIQNMLNISIKFRLSSERAFLTAGMRTDSSVVSERTAKS